MVSVANVFSWFLRIMILAISMFYLIEEDYLAFVLTLLGFLVSLVPIVVNAVYRVQLHWIFEVIVSWIMLWHITGFFGAYDTFPLWDDLGHVFGGAIMALLGFAWLYSMNVSKRIQVTVPLIGFMSVAWSTTIGVVWEIVEFLWDSVHGLVNVYGMMQNGLIDTMTDLSVDIVAAVCMVLICAYIVKNIKKTTDRVTNPFVEILERKKD